MPYYFVYESEYPEEGSEIIKADSEEAAAQEWMRQTGTTEADDPVLTVEKATVDLLLQRRDKAVGDIHHVAGVITDARMDHFREAIANFKEVDDVLMELGA